MTDKELFDTLSDSQRKVFYEIIGIFGRLNFDLLFRLQKHFLELKYGDEWLWKYMSPFERHTLGTFNEDQLELLERVANFAESKGRKGKR